MMVDRLKGGGPAGHCQSNCTLWSAKTTSYVSTRRTKISKEDQAIFAAEIGSNQTPYTLMASSLSFLLVFFSMWEG
jgi:hypothetical protein